MASLESGAHRIGIIGTGLLGVSIGKQLLPLPATEVAALTDINEESLARAGEELRVGADSRYTEYESMLAESSLDGVVITTPHTLHYEQITAALDDGLHVLCEKPLVLEVDQALELHRRTRDSDQVLMVGYQRHQDSAFRSAKERYVSDGPEIEHVSAEITQNWFEAFEGGWRMQPELSGNGFLCDTGRHVVDALLWMTNLTPVGVDATMEFDRPKIDRRATVTIEFDNGARATVATYGDAAGVREDHHIWDESGAAYVHGREWGGRELTTIDAEGVEHSPYHNRRDELNKAEWFIAAIEEGVEPPATARDAVRATAVINAAYESAETGDKVTIDVGLEASGISQI
jgi:predicted dehydrogenase